MSESKAVSAEAELEALKALQADAPELDRIESLLDRFNVFEAIGFVGQEVKHSRFLAFLLDPSQNHGLGKLFLKRFLQEALRHLDARAQSNLSEALKKDLSGTVVRREHQYMDVLLTNEDYEFAVIIENKVWTTEHSDQLSRYHDRVRGEYPDWQVAGIYLTPTGENPSNRNYHPLDYGTVCGILDEILQDREIVLDSDVWIAIKHYTDMVRRRILGDSELKRSSNRFYQRHKKALTAIHEYRLDLSAQSANPSSKGQK